MHKTPNITTNTRYQPLSYDQLLLQAQAYQRQREAEERARRSAQFDQYQEAEYKCLNRVTIMAFYEIHHMH